MRFRTVAVALLGFMVAWGATPVLGLAAPARVHSHSRAVLTVLSLINHDRQSAGLGPLHLDAALDRAALGHSMDMAQRRYFSHTAPDGSSPFDRIVRAGERYHDAGENLGTDNGRLRKTMLMAIEVAMLNSPEHRANLLRSTFSRVGIGVTSSGGTVYLTEDFAG